MRGLEKFSLRRAAGMPAAPCRAAMLGCVLDRDLKVRARALEDTPLLFHKVPVLPLTEKLGPHSIAEDKVRFEQRKSDRDLLERLALSTVDPDTELRRSAVAALDRVASFNDEAVVSRLIERLHDGSCRVRSAAALVLTHLAAPLAAAVSSDKELESDGEVAAGAASSKRVLDTLCKLVNDPDWSVRSTLCDILPQFLYRQPSSNFLCNSNVSVTNRISSANGVADSGIDTRRPRTAGSSGNLQVVPVRSRSARGPGPNAFAAAAAGRQPTTAVQKNSSRKGPESFHAAHVRPLEGREAAVRKAMLQLTADDSWSVRKLALQHLPLAAPAGPIGGDSEAVTAILERSLDPVAEVRRVALETLPSVADRRGPEFPRVLRRLLDLMDPKELMSGSAGCVGGVDVKLTSRWAGPKQIARDAVAELRSQVVVALERLAGRGNGAVMDGMIELLKRCFCVQHRVPFFLQQLSYITSPKADVRQATLVALSTLGDSSAPRHCAAVAAALRCLAETDEGVRTQARIVVPQLVAGEPRAKALAMQTATAYLAHENLRVRQAAVTVLSAVSGLQGEELAALNRQLDAIAGTDIGDTDTGVLVDDYQGQDLPALVEGSTGPASSVKGFAWKLDLECSGFRGEHWSLRLLGLSHTGDIWYMSLKEGTVVYVASVAYLTAMERSRFGNVIPFAITLHFSEGLSGRAAVARGGGDEPFTFDFGFLNIEEQNMWFADIDCAAKVHTHFREARLPRPPQGPRPMSGPSLSPARNRVITQCCSSAATPATAAVGRSPSVTAQHLADRQSTSVGRLESLLDELLHVDGHHSTISSGQSVSLVGSFRENVKQNETETADSLQELRGRLEGLIDLAAFRRILADIRRKEGESIQQLQRSKPLTPVTTGVVSSLGGTAVLDFVELIGWMERNSMLAIMTGSGRSPLAAFDVLDAVRQARCASDYHNGLSPEDIGALSFPLYCRTLRYLITRLQQKLLPGSVNIQQPRSGTLPAAFAGTSISVAKPALWLEWRRTIENNWNNRELYRRFGENRDGRQITLSMPKFSALLQDLKLSPDPVGRTLAWRCFSAAGSATERAVDDDVPATATANGTGAVAAGGVTGCNAGGLADPSDDSRRLIFAEFRRAMLNIAQALGTPVYLGGRNIVPPDLQEGASNGESGTSERAQLSARQQNKR